MKLTTSWQNIDKYEWTFSVGASVTFYLDAKYSSQDKTNNKTTVNTRLRSVLNSGSVAGSGYKFDCSYATSKSGSAVWTYKTETILSGEGTVTHNTNGSKSVTLSASVANTYLGLDEKLSATVELPTIQRYATANQSLNSKTQTTIKMNWSSDSTIDYIWYSINGGTNWTGINVADGKSGTYTISNLTAGTKYSIKTRVRRKDSQLTTDSSALSVTTNEYMTKYKINGVWKDAIPYIKVGGFWKKAIPYIKVDGAWKTTN